MSGFVARLTMDDGSVVVWEPADPAVISVAEQVDVGEHIGSLVAAAPGKTYPKSLVVDNVKSVQYAPGVYRDPAEAAAHARGVAEERARLRSALEYVTHRSDCGHGHDDVIHIAPAHFTGPACPHCSDAEYADRMEREDPCLICAALAAMAPSSPSDDRGGPEGEGGV